MSLGYDFVLNRASCDTINARSRRSRDQLLEFFRGLAERPFTEGDYREVDDRGMPVEVMLFREVFLVHWHVDHAAKEIRVFEIEIV